MQICVCHFFCVILHAKLKQERDMKKQEPKQMALGTETPRVGTPPQKYFTADEAMAFLEPRIRAMFK